LSGENDVLLKKGEGRGVRESYLLLCVKGRRGRLEALAFEGRDTSNPNRKRRGGGRKGSSSR